MWCVNTIMVENNSQDIWLLSEGCLVSGCYLGTIVEYSLQADQSCVDPSEMVFKGGELCHFLRRDCALFHIAKRTWRPFRWTCTQPASRRAQLLDLIQVLFMDLRVRAVL